MHQHKTIITRFNRLNFICVIVKINLFLLAMLKLIKQNKDLY